jgi:hypothetical protein
MTKHLNAIALALLHLPFQSRAFNSITRAGISVRHLTQSRLCCDQELRFNGGKINGKSASFRRLTLKDSFFNRNRFSHPVRPNVKSLSTKMTAHDVFNMQQDWQDLKRSIQTIEPKYRSIFFQAAAASLWCLELYDLQSISKFFRRSVPSWQDQGVW